MSNTEDTQFQEMDERIERFLRGEMTVEEEARFRDELKSDPDLREHARAISALLKGIRAEGEQHDQEIISEVTTNKRPNSIRRIALWIASAAAVLALYVGYSYHAENVRFTQVNEMLTPYYEHYDIDALSRGETDSVAIVHLYTLFNRIPEEKNMTDIITELEPIYESLDYDITYAPYANDVMWNLALAYMKDKETAKASEILQKLIVDNPGMPISAKAKALLKDNNAL
ncbi:MAG: hypothetical protein IJJ94_00210 [Bacteroidaceae bacterium]|nr:hypothetical protein [Bacteroidaceae bacterium]